MQSCGRRIKRLAIVIPGARNEKPAAIDAAGSFGRPLREERLCAVYFFFVFLAGFLAAFFFAFAIIITPFQSGW
jgi:hypothetical protein